MDNAFVQVGLTKDHYLRIRASEHRKMSLSLIFYCTLLWDLILNTDGKEIYLFFGPLHFPILYWSSWNGTER